MNPLVRYSLQQAVRSSGNKNRIGPVYATPLIIQRDYEFYSILSGLCRAVRHVFGAVPKVSDERRCAPEGISCLTTTNFKTRQDLEL